MKARDILMLAVGGFLGLLACVFLQAFLFRSPAPAAPTLGGQQVPNENFVIDFSRRYKIVLADARGNNTSYENAQILGYTGETVRESSGSLSRGYGHFGRWLVIELPDKRRVFLPPHNISLLEDTDPTP